MVDPAARCVGWGRVAVAVGVGADDAVVDVVVAFVAARDWSLPVRQATAEPGTLADGGGEQQGDSADAAGLAGGLAEGTHKRLQTGRRGTKSPL